MKKILEKIWNFAKRYPFTFLFICLFIWINIGGFVSYLHFNNMIPTRYAFLSLIPLVVFGLVIFLFIKVFGNKNRFVKGIILFFINIFFWYANIYVSDECWAIFCKTLTNPETYVKIVPFNDYLVNWKQFGDGLYLNTDFICYYKDKENNHHAVITLKTPKGYISDEPFEYMYVVSDMNLTQKTDTSLRLISFNNGHKTHSCALDKTNPKNTHSISTNSKIGRVYQYLMSQNKFMHAAVEKYMKDVHKKVEKNWEPCDKNEKGTIKIQFKVNKNGEVSSIEIKSSNVSKNNENSVVDAIKKSAPFKPLPKDIDTNDKGFVYMDFVFDMNKGKNK